MSNIVGHWKKEEPVNKPNPKEIANAIAEFPKDCQDKVTKLVEKLGFEVEKKPEPKAGQVWLYDGEPRLLVSNDNIGVFATSLAGKVTCKGGRFHRLIDTNNYTFVADTLEDYFLNRKDKP